LILLNFLNKANTDYKINQINIILHKKFSKIIRKNLTEKYLRINYYTKIQTDALVEDRYCHIMALMRDNVLYTTLDEHLRRYYKFAEIMERIPKIAKYYKNYLLFFCKPTFSNLLINKLIHIYGELKGELYYNQNYGNIKNCNDYQKDSNKDDIINNYKKIRLKNQMKSFEMMLNTSIKNEIDKNSMTISTICKDNSYLNMNTINTEIFAINKKNKDNKSKNNNKINKLSLNNNPSNKNSLYLYYNDKNKDIRKSLEINNKNIYEQINNDNNKKTKKNLDKMNLFNNIFSSIISSLNNNDIYNNKNINRNKIKNKINNINLNSKEKHGSKIIKKNSILMDSNLNTNTNAMNKYSSSK
jgi:hypothetical protein